ncbi:glutaredoxin family protein [Elongatibacter sediminis]|uniref:Glutaredoxin family protein n=1 Tax=Elongatibacter sediminis TaxID=3119006 RepID=A0AAW9RIC8_9GAMM
MKRARELILYTRPECHLCDLAAQMLENGAIPWQRVDIESDIDLITRYGTRIPVIYRPDVDQALYWPFSEEQLSAFAELEI